MKISFRKHAGIAAICCGVLLLALATRCQWQHVNAAIVTALLLVVGGAVCHIHSIKKQSRY